MEDFIVSARKYRPQEFDAVIGQSHVTHTLYNAIRNNQLAHALLFTGPRGVGKTTCARIVAKMINQSSDDDTTDYSLNVLELDAASNNSVDDIRQLNDQVRFAPQVGRYKVYIVDEVHMLSTAAFNAFLKTLEEPPAHVKFVLATTEKHKILPTILSRCQVYDFKRISIEEIIKHLQKVADKEGITAEKQALHIIAEKADGAMRDALSIFDRVVSFSGKNLTYKAVLDNLNILDYDYYFRVVDCLLKGDSRELLLIYNEILENGHEGQLFVNGLASHLRDLLVATDSRTYKLLNVSEELKQKYFTQAGLVNPNQIFKSLKLLSEADYKYKSSSNTRLLVELTLLQMIPVFASARKPEEKKNELKEVAPTQNTKPIAKAEETEASFTRLEKTEPAQLEVKKTETDTQERKPEAAQEAEIKKPLLDQTKARRSSFSISESIKPAEEEKTEEEIIKPKRDKAFKAEQIIEIWTNFAQSLEDKKDRMHSAMMRECTPKIEGAKIKLEFNTITQQNLFRDFRQEIIDLMRNTLENDYLEFEEHITERKKEDEGPSPQEKFMAFRTKHPIVSQMLEELKLDPDF